MGGKDIKQGYRRKGTQRLTLRQIEILNLLKLGLTDRAIGIELGITEMAVSNRISHGILSRLGAQNRTHAVYIAMRDGLIN